ncbi:putative holin-like toxin [Leuconostoc suionicum]
MSVASAITIMIAFGTFVLVLVQVVIAIINSTKK